MRFGVIGTGKITHSFVEAAMHVDHAEVTAVYSRQMIKAQEFAQQYNIPHTFDDLDTFANSSAFDAVYIASPNRFHAAQSQKMLQAQKHVLCEKPITSNYTEYASVQKCAEENSRLYLEAVIPLHSPFMSTIEDNLPKLGIIRRVSLHFNQYSSRYDNFQKGIIENAFNPSLSNGALMDIGVYCVQMLIYLFGYPDRIQSSTVKLSNGLDGQGFILADYHGMLAELSFSKISDGFSPNVIQGEKGSLIFFPLTAPSSMLLQLKNQPPQVLLSEAEMRPMQYEMKQFMAMAGNINSAQRYLDCSKQSMLLLDEVRRQANIVFPADANVASK